MGSLSNRLRIAVLERDGYRCVYCGLTSAEATLQVDHVNPRSLGGSDDATNLVAACFDCNNGKRANIIRLPDHVKPAPLPEVEPKTRPRYLYPGQRGYRSAVREAWRQEAEKRYPDDKDRLDIEGDGRWASVAWCGQMSVHLFGDKHAAMRAVEAIDRGGCGHACGTWEPNVPWAHDIVDLSAPEPLVEWWERSRGVWRIAHLGSCSTCRYLTEGQGQHAAEERMSMRCLKAMKQDRRSEP